MCSLGQHPRVSGSAVGPVILSVDMEPNVSVSSRHFLSPTSHVLWCCLLGDRKSIRPVKKWVMRCWCDYLSWARCKWSAYGPADATATPSSLAWFWMVLPFCYWLIQFSHWMPFFLFQAELTNEWNNIAHFASVLYLTCPLSVSDISCSEITCYATNKCQS